MLLFSLEQFRVFKKKRNTWNSVSQTGPLTIGGSPGGAQAVLEEKALQTLNKLKYTLIHACTKTAFVGRPSQEVGELVLSTTSCSSVIIWKIL